MSGEVTLASLSEGMVGTHSRVNNFILGEHLLFGIGKKYPQAVYHAMIFPIYHMLGLVYTLCFLPSQTQLD